MEEKLKPCPFCGGEAIVMPTTDWVIPGYQVVCTECGGAMKLYMNNTVEFMNEVIEAWNARVSDD